MRPLANAHCERDIYIAVGSLFDEELAHLHVECASA